MKLRIISFAIAVVFLLTGALLGVFISPNVGAIAVSSMIPSSQVSLNGAQEVYSYTNQVSGTGGIITYTITAYEDSSGNFIYTVYEAMSADSSSNYWLAGDINDHGKWSAQISLYDPFYACYYPELGGFCCVVYTNFNYMYDQPSNSISAGQAGTVTTGQSFNAGVSAYDASVGGAYSVTYTYDVPCFITSPFNMTLGNTSWEFSDNAKSAGFTPYSASWETSATVAANTGEYQDLYYYIMGQFAHSSIFYYTYYKVYENTFIQFSTS
ncbi:MAG: hypothetical protein ACP5OC_08275 [Thermoplasmata archaeon]